MAKFDMNNVVEALNHMPSKERNVILRWLAKEQKRLEPVKPTEKGGDVRCGKCGAYMDTATAARYPQPRACHKYCEVCGCAIDWTDFERLGEPE